MTAARTYTTESGQQVSEVPGQPGTVRTGRPASAVLRRPTDPFAGIPGCAEEDDPDPTDLRDTCPTCPPGMPCCCTADCSDIDWDRERD